MRGSGDLWGSTLTSQRAVQIYPVMLRLIPDARRCYHVVSFHLALRLLEEVSSIVISFVL